MRISTAARYKKLKDYRLGVPVLLTNVSYNGNIIYTQNSLRTDIGWKPNTFSKLGQDIDGEAAGDNSGISVSINATGDRVAIGANLNDGSGSSAGQVRIYQYNGASWVQLGQDIDGEAAGDNSGISVSINATGDRVAIGATFNDVSGSNDGQVRIYQYNGASWVQLGQDIDGEAVEDRSGISVSINTLGDRVAIGAYLNDGSGLNAGHVRIYQYNGASWVQLGQDIDGEATGDQSGISVSINATGDRVAIGAYLNDGSGVDAGQVRIYQYNGTSWVQLGQDIDGETSSDNSGISVSINATGDRVAIGATLNDGSDLNAGQVRIYQYNGASWVQLGQDIDGETSSDNLGISVSINATGDRVAIGAYLNDGSGLNAGHVRIYDYNGSNWVQLVQEIDGETALDRSGISVSINAVGDRVAIGATLNDGSGSNAGQVRIYNLSVVFDTNTLIYTSFNDELITINKPIWKYTNTLSITGGWYNDFSSKFITSITDLSLSASRQTDTFSEPGYTKGLRWVEIATKKNTNVSTTTLPQSVIYFKQYGFTPKLLSKPIITWNYKGNTITEGTIYDNFWSNIAPLNTVLSASSIDSVYLNYLPEVPLTINNKWVDSYNSKEYYSSNLTLSSNTSIQYYLSATSYKNATTSSTSNTFVIYPTSSALFTIGYNAVSALSARLVNLPRIPNNTNLFTVKDPATKTFTRNPQMWCADLVDQLTSQVAYKYGSIYSYGGILITPRHVLYVEHAFPRTEKVLFVTSNSVAVTANQIGSADSKTWKNDPIIQALSAIDPAILGGYGDIGITVLDQDVTLSGINIIPFACITPTEKSILNTQYIPTLLFTQAPGRSTGSSNPNALSASDLQICINSTNWTNMTTAWVTNSANPFYNWDVDGGGYRLWDGDSGNSHLLFNNNKLYVYSTSTYSTGSGPTVSALSGIINFLITKADVMAGINTGLTPTYYTLDQIANR